MRLSPQRMFIPLLVSFSITGAGVVLLYFINKKKDEENFKSNQKPKPSIEIPIPDKIVPTVIGRGGSTVKELEKSTNTVIEFKEDGNVTGSVRTCVVTGDLENLKLAEEKIKEIVRNVPLIETYEQWVPHRTVLKMTEKGGIILKEIQNLSNAKIIIESISTSKVTNLDEKKRLILKGTAEQIATGMLLIQDRVQEDNESKAKTANGSFNRVPRVKSSPNATPDNSSKSTDSEPTSTKQILESQARDGKIDVFVCAVDNPSQFYIQVISPTNEKLDGLIKEMTEYYENEENKELHALRDITAGQKVAAKFTIDNKWYRAEIVSDLGNNKYDVYFVDFGDRDKVLSANILELRTDFLSLRFQAIECCLSGVKPKTGDWSAEATEKFSELCELAHWQPRIAKIKGFKDRVFNKRERSPLPSIELYHQRKDQLINISQELIKFDLAIAESETWSGASSTVSLSRRSKSPDVISPMSNGNGSGSNGTKHSIEEIDLTVTPKSKQSNSDVEVIDLTTPIVNKKPQNGSTNTRDFIENERNGSYKPRPSNPFMRNSNPTKVNIIPGGYEDESGNDESCDEYEFN